jgi:hypothetical protein
MLHLHKRTENQDFEMAFVSTDKKELLQTWSKLGSHAQPPFYGLQPTTSHISRVKVWNKIHICIQTDIIGEVRG